MRGKPQAQPEFLTTINLNQRVPADHPLRGIKIRLDQVLAKLSPLFDEPYAGEGRPSIPPEQLFKNRITMALYSMRSERLFCEQLAYNLLWLWFLDRELDEGALTRRCSRIIMTGCCRRTLRSCFSCQYMICRRPKAGRATSILRRMGR